MRRGGGDPETALSRTEPEPELETLSTVVRVSLVLSSVAQLIQKEIRLIYRPGCGGASPREGAGFYDFPLSSRQCRRNCILFPSFKEGFKEGLDHSFKELQENLPLVSPVLTHGPPSRHTRQQRPQDLPSFKPSYWHMGALGSQDAC